jgi:hypothetical protein
VEVFDFRRVNCSLLRVCFTTNRKINIGKFIFRVFHCAMLGIALESLRYVSCDLAILSNLETGGERDLDCLYPMDDANPSSVA